MICFREVDQLYSVLSFAVLTQFISTQILFNQKFKVVEVTIDFVNCRTICEDLKKELKTESVS